jgi:hypothetical protein
MKPTMLTTCNASRCDSFDPAMRNCRESLIVNYHYHSVAPQSSVRSGFYGFKRTLNF